LTAGTLAIGLAKRDGSGVFGVALLRADGDLTEVTLHIARPVAADGPPPAGTPIAFR